jgi:hypothetical protein
MLQNKEGGLEFINKQLSIYLPLYYPIFYLYGELGWWINYPFINKVWVPQDRVIDINNTIGEDSKASNNEANEADTIH